MADRVRAAFVGAGRRGFGAHYPAISQLRDEVEVVAICELDVERRRRGLEFLDLPDERGFDDLDAMLEKLRPDLVYSIMGPDRIRPVAERCFAAGCHVVMEKPPGQNIKDVEAILAAARKANRQGIVTFQRRHAAVTKEAQRRILARGPLTHCHVEFHKDLLAHQQSPDWSTLWDDGVHVVDLARYLCGGRVVSVKAEVSKRFVDWTNSYEALVRFDNGATALISCLRSSGNRFVRVAAHGRGIAAYMDDFPRQVRFLADGADETVAGEPETEAVVAMHRHFIECIRENKPATSNLEDAIETMRLCDAIERGGT